MENQPLQEHKASPEMMKFFTKLLHLKTYVEALKDVTESSVMKIIYEKLDEIIKDSNEEKK